jgi:hemolysin activation/secretion protein
MAKGNSHLFRKPYIIQWLLLTIFFVLFLLNLSLTAHAASSVEAAPAGAAIADQQVETFPIRRFVIYGNTAFPRDTLRKLLNDLRGQEQTAADVEKARDRIEKYYHENGYPTTLVNIPEQPIEGGFVYLQVIEGKVGSLSVKGNSWLSEKRIRKELPSMASGEIVNLPQIKKELMRANSIPDAKVIPAMSPGKEVGKTDVELKVEDRIPLHGSLEVNDRNSHDTTLLRVNAALRYDDLWGLGHSINFQYQVSPQNFSEVEVFSGSYILPAPWADSNRIVLYGVWSNSSTTFGESFNTIGKGSIIGGRYVLPFPPFKSYNHSAVLGFDYKHFDENTIQGSAADIAVSSPVEYLPLSLAYNGSLPDSSGLTLFNCGFNMAFRGLITRQQNFDDKRYMARANYFYAVLGAERRQRLPAGLSLLVKLDGQIADHPLISNEQYAAGGMESVRGYKESEEMGDSAFHGVLELAAPNLASKLGPGEGYLLTPYIFYDFAALWVQDPLPGQDAAMDIQGTGIGIRGLLFGDLEFETDWGFALKDTTRIKKGDSQVHFKVKYQF